MKTSVEKAYQRGVWTVRVLPIFFLLLWSAGSIWLAFDGYINYTLALYAIGLMLILTFLWSQYQLGKWKMWMVANAENPKTVLEKARSGFMKFRILENMAFLGSKARKRFQEEYDERMSQIRVAHLNSATEKYDVSNVVTVHKKMTSTLRLIVFEFIVGATVTFLFIYQTDNMLRLISGTLLVATCIGLYFTFRTLWSKNKSVLEVSQHGIRIHDNYYGWIELDEVDVIKGDTLIYKPHHGEKLKLRVDNLSMSADYLDELILFYRTAHVSEEDNNPS